MYREHFVQAGEGEHAENRVTGTAEFECAFMLLHSLQTTDQDCEPGRVHELDIFEVDEQPVPAFTDLLCDLILESGRGVNINFTLDRNDRPIMASLYVHYKIDGCTSPSTFA